QVDESTSSDESPGLDLPDGLLHFRNNLLELLVDICQLLRPTTFAAYFFGGLPSSNISMPLREIEAKLFALIAVSEIILQEGEAFDFSLIMQLVSAFSVRPSSELKGFICVIFLDRWQMLLAPFQDGSLFFQVMVDPCYYFLQEGFLNPFVHMLVPLLFLKFVKMLQL
ncbi:unnamed protein product, partial [Brassica rapa subsp. trilocularis]